MPSRSLLTWQTTAARALDEIEAAHRAIGGSGPGRRYATQQINQAYTVMLSSQFQRFCRDLHSEAADLLAGTIANMEIRIMFREQLTWGRKLDVGNPNPGNIGSDYARLHLQIWSAVHALDARNQHRQQGLETMGRWRNAIAHQDFSSPLLGGRSALRLSAVQTWRRMCNALADDFDSTLGRHLTTIIGTRPW